MKNRENLTLKYPPSEPCSCKICLGYCARPGWWTVRETARAINAGYSRRMMLEISPDRSFGVVSPAFKGCEGNFALQEYASRGCNFLKNNLCELHGSGYQPLECRVCHHDRPGMGPQCHEDIEKEWNTPAGRAVVIRWVKLTGIWDVLDIFGLSQLKG
jgi:hypothetical protein